MALTKTPICDFGQPAVDFNLLGVDGKRWTLQDCREEHGLLVMFICNHCPYVKAITTRLVETTRSLIAIGVGCVAIMSNDPDQYPEDSLENMKAGAKKYHFPFPYLWDETQAIARVYGAVCTPDFFGYNRDLKLHYRGRLDEGVLEPPKSGATPELFEAMRQIVATGQGPQVQIPSMGCSIKWK